MLVERGCPYSSRAQKWVIDLMHQQIRGLETQVLQIRLVLRI